MVKMLTNEANQIDDIFDRIVEIKNNFIKEFREREIISQQS